MLLFAPSDMSGMTRSTTSPLADNPFVAVIGAAGACFAAEAGEGAVGTAVFISAVDEGCILCSSNTATTIHKTSMAAISSDTRRLERTASTALLGGFIDLACFAPSASLRGTG